MSETKQAGWVVVTTTALRQLWLGWPGPLLLLGFSLFLSVNVFLLAADPEMNVLSQAKMIDLTLQEIVLAGIVMALLVGANTFSGERDRQTLESLLLTPTPRGQIATGKFLAVLSLWLGMVPIAIPYIVLANSGTNLLGESLLILVVLGTCVVALSAGIGVVVSASAPTNIISFAVNFVILAILVIPTQLPGQVQELPGVSWFIAINPVTAATRYQGIVLVDGESWVDNLGWVISPLLALLLVGGVGIWLLDRRLTLHGGLMTRTTVRKTIVLALISMFFLSFLLPAPVRGQGSSTNDALSVTINPQDVLMVAGDWATFDTELLNSGSEATPALVAHFSVSSIKAGPHVDPEDWSDQRTQFLPPLAPGEAVTLNWRLHGLFDGNFVVYITVFSPEPSFKPAMSLPMFVHITPDEILVMKNVIPVVTLVPLIPLAYLLIVVSYRRPIRSLPRNKQPA